MMMAKANPFLSKAFLIIYPPFSKRWLKVKDADIKYQQSEKIKKNMGSREIFFDMAISGAHKFLDFGLR
ncbi:MAG: hypothetical protein WBW55_04845 [Desulfobaccales bacterium]